MFPLLIAFNGYKKSGKNTAGEVVAEWGFERNLVVVQRAFADILKLSAARCLGLYNATNINDAVVLMDSLKESGIIDISIPEQSIMKSISGREYLKWFGTEGHRDVFGKDFWVDQLLPFTDKWIDNFSLEGDDDHVIRPDISVITDLRFVSESERVKLLGGYVWNIDRGYDPEDHASEQPLPEQWIDLKISNKSTLEAFKTNLSNVLTENFHTRFEKRILDRL